MQNCLKNWVEMPWADLFCEMAHLGQSALNYFILTEEERMNACWLENTNTWELLKSLKWLTHRYLSEKNKDTKNHLREEISDMLLRYITSLDASDIAWLSGYGFMLEYNSQKEPMNFQSSKVASKAGTNQLLEKENRASQLLHFNLHFREILKNWEAYIYSKKFPSVVTNQYLIIIERLGIFMDSPKELEIYKAALEALNKKHGTSYSEMLQYTTDKKREKSV